MTTLNDAFDLNEQKEKAYSEIYKNAPYKPGKVCINCIILNKDIIEYVYADQFLPLNNPLNTRFSEKIDVSDNEYLLNLVTKYIAALVKISEILSPYFNNLVNDNICIFRPIHPKSPDNIFYQFYCGITFLKHFSKKNGYEYEVQYYVKENDVIKEIIQKLEV